MPVNRVEGDNGTNLIDDSFVDDPEGDRIDNNDAPDGSNDDVVDAGGGDDTIRSGEGDDTVYAGSGSDSVDGGAGDDVIFGDSNVEGGIFDGGATVRESFEWDKAPDPNGPNPIEDGDPLSHFTQNTGNVNVTFEVTQQSSSNISHTFSDEDQFVKGIDSGDEHIDDESGLVSDLGGQAHASATYDLRFSAPVENADFRINDIDGSSRVTVRAFDAQGNEIPVTLTAGHELKMLDANTVRTKDLGEYDDPDDGDFSARVQIDGPVSRIEIHHTEGDFNSGIWVTDVYFDVPLSDTGAAGDDTLRGGDGDDIIYGEGGDDSIDGGDGDDLLSGGEGTNILRGGDGDDTFIGGAGADSFDGGRDLDVIDYSASGAAVNVDLSTSTLSGGDAENDTILNGVDGVIGSDHDDTLTGFNGQSTSEPDVFTNVLDGGAGNDTIDGRGGDDSLIGGADDDSILGGGGNDTIFGDTAASPVKITVTDGSTAFDNELFAYTIDLETGTISNVQTLTQSVKSDSGQTFSYSAAPGAVIGVGIVNPDGDIFFSSGYGDNLDLNTGEQVQTKPVGVDADGSVNIVFEDNDVSEQPNSNFDDVFVKVDLGTSGTSFDNAHFEAVSDVPETAGDGNDVIDGGTGNDLIFGQGGDDSITGGDGDDTIFGGNGSDTVDGGAGDDFIDTSAPLSAAPLPDLGFPGLFPADPDPDNDRDLVFGGDGNDTIFTGDDADTIDGGAGNDFIDAGIDADEIKGGEGDDTIIGGEGSDTIEGGAGDDLIFGGLDPIFPDSLNIPDDNPSGPDDPVTDNGRDLIFGGDGNDTIFGQDDDDTIHGGDGADSIDAGIDDDEVFGGDGDDTILGGDGDDTITGGAGADSMSGGDGRDTFIIGSVSDADGDIVDGGSGGDDFDTLNLTGLGPFVKVGETTDADGNSTSGTINFLDTPGGNVVGSLTFTEIENIVPCFTPGTRIATPRGEVAVEDLREGDRVITRDNGLQEVRWVGSRALGAADLMAAPHLRPVRIRAGALGHGLPERDMLVSPQHRVLLTSERAALYFGEREVLAAARHLTGMEGIAEARTTGTTYIHFMCDRHEVVLSEGAWTESFQPGEQVLDGMGDASREEIFSLFPELRERTGVEAFQAARRSLKRHEARLLVE